MKKLLKFCFGFGILTIAFSADVFGQALIDKEATKKTRALFENLKKISQKGLLVGHQDGDAYGTTWKEIPGKSDVKDVTGSYPAVHGWDVSKLGVWNFNL